MPSKSPENDTMDISTSNETLGRRRNLSNVEYIDNELFEVDTQIGQI